MVAGNESGGRVITLLQGIGPNYLGGTMDNESRIAIHMAHRGGAIVTTVVLLLLCWRMYFQDPNTADSFHVGSSARRFSAAASAGAQQYLFSLSPVCCRRPQPGWRLIVIDDNYLELPDSHSEIIISRAC